eukprot:3404891-Pyramimonas_sp.AAC.1
MYLGAAGAVGDGHVREHAGGDVHTAGAETPAHQIVGGQEGVRRGSICRRSEGTQSQHTPL